MSDFRIPDVLQTVHVQKAEPGPPRGASRSNTDGTVSELDIGNPVGGAPVGTETSDSVAHGTRR